MKNISILLLFFVLFFVSPVYSIQDEADSPLDETNAEVDINDYHFMFWAGMGVHKLDERDAFDKFKPGMILLGGIELPLTSNNTLSIEGIIYNWFALRYKKKETDKDNDWFKSVDDNTICSESRIALSLKYSPGYVWDRVYPSILIGFGRNELIQFGIDINYDYNELFSFSMLWRVFGEWDLFHSNGHNENYPEFVALRLSYKI